MVRVRIRCRPIVCWLVVFNVYVLLSVVIVILPNQVLCEHSAVPVLGGNVTITT